MIQKASYKHVNNLTNFNPLSKIIFKVLIKSDKKSAINASQDNMHNIHKVH